MTAAIDKVYDALNEYAESHYAELQATNAELLEALRQISTIVLGGKKQMENQIQFVWITAREAINKALRGERCSIG